MVDLKCTVCGRPYHGETDRYVCPHCGASIEPELDVSAFAESFKTLLSEGGDGSSIWRYQSLFPGLETVEPVSMGEGNTPLLHAKSLEKTYGSFSLYLKNETMNPTYTYKDRFASLLISLLVHDKAAAVALGSAGNAGCAVAAYAAKAGIPCYVVLPDGGVITRGKQAMSYGARFIRCKGEVNDCIEIVETGAARYGWRNGCTTMLHNPLASEGYKSIVYEIFQQMQQSLPDVIIAPIGGGILISKLYRACKELQTVGLIRTLPRLVGVQAEGCPPVVWAFEHDREDTPVWKSPRTIASSINDPVTFEGRTALYSIRRSNGTAVAVSDKEIQTAMQQTAALEAVLAEPASAAAIAAAKKLYDSGWIRPGERVVSIVTGSGLRDMPLYESAAGESSPVITPGDDAQTAAAIAFYQRKN